MKTYPPGHWKALGSWIAGARTQAGYSDTKEWSAAASRSTRQLLGLERGESVGPKTIEAVATALEVDSGVLFGILEAGEASTTWSEAKAVRLAEQDREALANPEESTYWTRPQGDEADEHVTWGHMEDRLSEIERRILRLERSVLRVINARETGGDGHADDPKPGSTAPTKPPHLSDADWRELQEEQSGDDSPGDEPGEDEDPVTDPKAL